MTTGTRPCGRRLDDEQFAFTQAPQSASSWLATAAGLELRDADELARVSLVPPELPDIIGDWVVARHAAGGGKLVGHPKEPC